MVSLQHRAFYAGIVQGRPRGRALARPAELPQWISNELHWNSTRIAGVLQANLRNSICIIRRFLEVTEPFCFSFRFIHTIIRNEHVACIRQ